MIYYRYYYAQFCAYGIAKGCLMEIFRVSLFGHREIDSLREIDDLLIPHLKRLMNTHQFITFFIGRSGEFDEYAASVIKCIQRDYGEENTELALVIPYTISNLDDYEKYYNSIIIPEHLAKVHPKSAITLRNRWMVENSDLVIAYVKRNYGGAYAAFKYAQRMHKHTINLCENFF